MKKDKFKKILATGAMGLCALSLPMVLTGCSKEDEFNLRVEGDFVQWQKEGDSDWNNLLSLEEVKDILGEAYKGDKGDKGEQGNPGIDGREVEFRANNGYLQWRYKGEESWKDLIPYSQTTPDFQEYISIYNICTEYLVDEEIDLSNAYLKYHKSEENFDIVKITEDMIAWQGTGVIGEYEMMVIYNGKAATQNYFVYDAYSIVEQAVENSIAKGSVKVNIDSVEGAEIYYILKTDCGYSYNYGEYNEQFDEKSLRQGWDFALEDGSFNNYNLTIYDGEITDAEKSVRAIEDLDTIGNYLSMYSYFFGEEYIEIVEGVGETIEFSLIKNDDNSFSVFSKITDTARQNFTINYMNIKNSLIQSVGYTTISMEDFESVQSLSFKENSTFTYGDFEIPELPEGIDWEIVSGNL